VPGPEPGTAPGWEVLEQTLHLLAAPRLVRRAAKIPESAGNRQREIMFDGDDHPRAGKHCLSSDVAIKGRHQASYTDVIRARAG
jgi:hypothetical protein